MSFFYKFPTGSSMWDVFHFFLVMLKEDEHFFSNIHTQLKYLYFIGEETFLSSFAMLTNLFGAFLTSALQSKKKNFSPFSDKQVFL